MQTFAQLNITQNNIRLFSVTSFTKQLLPDKFDIVFVDIDDTILTPGKNNLPHYFCGSLWFHHKAKYLQSIEIGKYFELFNHCTNHTGFVPVSNEMNDYLQEQSKLTPILGLTARQVEIIDLTVKNLNSINFTFSDHQHAMAIKGIIFAGSNITDGAANHKGEIILDVVQRLNQPVKNLVFIDDNIKNILQVNESLYNMGMNATLIHLATISDLLFSSYNFQEVALLGEIQEEHFIRNQQFLENKDVIGDQICKIEF